MEVMQKAVPEPERKELELVFQNEEKAMRANDLQGFLFYLNMYYLKVMNEYDLSSISMQELTILSQGRGVGFSFNRNDYLIYSKAIYTASNDLTIIEIDKHSPLRMVFGGAIVALVAALILSGGTVEIDVSKLGFKATISKSLGESLQDLKNAYKN